MGVAISGLVAATVINETDQLEIEQAGVSKKITKTQLRALLFSDPAFATPALVPQIGDVPSYNGTDFAPGAVPRWRVIHQDAYTESAPASTSTITFDGGATAIGINKTGTFYFKVGFPVRFVQSGTTYYAICTAITASLLTIAGAPLIAATPITELAVGTPEMVREEVLFVNSRNTSGVQLNYATGATCLSFIGLQYRRWTGPKAYCVSYRATHKSATSPIVTLLINGVAASTSGITISATAGAWTTVGAVVMDPIAYDINMGEDIEIYASSVAGSYFLSLVATFILE